MRVLIFKVDFIVRRVLLKQIELFVGNPKGLLLVLGQSHRHLTFNLRVSRISPFHQFTHPENPNLIVFLLPKVRLTLHHQNITLGVDDPIFQFENDGIFVSEVQVLPSQRIKVQVEFELISV